MQSDEILGDLRISRGRIWNVKSVLLRFPFGKVNDPWNKDATTATEEDWIDEFVYLGYRRHGAEFLECLSGRFAIAYFDKVNRCLFLARDWIGEIPLHLLATPKRILVANTIGALRKEGGVDYTYQYVKAFPHSHAQEIDLSFVESDCIGLRVSPKERILFCDFSDRVSQAAHETGDQIQPFVLALSKIRLEESVRNRACFYKSPLALLLSGGLDSLSIGLIMKAQNLPFEAFTLSIDGAGNDVAIAAEFSKQLGVTHHIIRVSPKEVVDAFEEAVSVAEHYPIYNIYCTVGMVLLARGLARCGLKSAFCGEAVNEALGDYTDWEVINPTTGKMIVLQRIDSERLRTPEMRETLVWGHPCDKGKHNIQLGSGLAKHAGSRMIKPFLAHGITLECPYYDLQLLAQLVALPKQSLENLGGKAGLFLNMFKSEIERFGIDKDLILNCAKVRLQDATEGGEGGITTALLSAGCDQRKAIELFNKDFGAALDPNVDSRRLTWIEDRQHFNKE